MSGSASRFRPAAKAALLLLLPFGVILLAYQLQSEWPAAWRGAIHVTQPRALELRWFGIREAGGLVTPGAWLQRHLHPTLDLIAGAAYLAFVPAFLASVFWWRFGPAPEAERAERAVLAQRAMWALCAMYLAGYLTFLAWPAAPPWYFARYGAVIVPNAPPEAAGALRFDALVGAPVFAKYYGLSLNVFGAFPSLHCGTAFLGLLFAWRLRSLRAASLLLFAAVAFAAVYLNHHYLIDELGGMAYATAAFALTARGVRNVQPPR